MVGAKTQIIWDKVGAKTLGARLGHRAWLGQSWGEVGAWMGHGWGKKAWDKV